jgi:hypothetical protein
MLCHSLSIKHILFMFSEILMINNVVIFVVIILAIYQACNILRNDFVFRAFHLCIFAKNTFSGIAILE